MLRRTPFSNLGSRVYGLGAVALGLVGLVWGDFATVWQPIQALTGVLDVVGSRLLTLMLAAFGALVWAPALFAQPREHTVWAGNAINLALVGVAWVVADAIASHRRRTRGLEVREAPTE